MVRHAQVAHAYIRQKAAKRPRPRRGEGPNAAGAAIGQQAAWTISAASSVGPQGHQTREI